MDENVAAIWAIVEKDAQVTVAQLEVAIRISLGSIHTILHNKLYLQKICAHWVPH
jgi:hypothetical protein